MTAQRQGPMSTIIRWDFTRGNERLHCQVDRSADDGTRAAFKVVLVLDTLRKASKASAETFHAVAPALWRHANLVAALRANGWKLVAYTDPVAGTRQPSRRIAEPISA